MIRIIISSSHVIETQGLILKSTLFVFYIYIYKTCYIYNN